MSTETPLDWQAPKFEAGDDEKMGWIEDAIKEGEGFLSGQTAYKNLGKNLDIFDAICRDNTKSRLETNGLKYDLRKFIETISEVREIGSYSSDAKQFKQFANIANIVAKGVYLESEFPRQIRKALQFGTLGRGYIWSRCVAKDYGYGERRITFSPKGLLDVVPVQVPDTNDVQDSYAVTVFHYMPIAEAHARFPLFQSELRPISSVSYKSRVGARRLDYAERFRMGDQTSRSWGSLYCEIRYTYIRDIRINTPPKGMPGFELPMGDLGTSWFYKVPFVGQDIPGGVMNGQRQSRKATAEDCRVYPFLRLMISAAGMARQMYDGPQFDMHGCIPTVQYDLDDWAWEALGRSLIQDVGSIEVTKRNVERKMDQVITTSLNPPMGYDRTAVQGPKIENFDIFAQDQRTGLDGKPRDVLQSLLPDSVVVTGEHFKFLEMLQAARRQQLGIDDLGSLARAKLNLSADNLDQALEPIGPIAKGIAAGMEAANAKIAYMLKFQIPQWYDTKRIIEYTGPDQISQEVLDFDPASLIPSHMPDELVEGQVPTTPSLYEKIERIRYFTKNLRLISVPSTLLEMTAQKEQLKWMSLKFKNAPISWSTVMAKLGIENYGSVPGDTEREKWVNEQIEDLKLKAAAAHLAQQLGLSETPQAGGGEGKGQGKGGGRPPSGKKPMKQAQKGGAGGEPRVVNKES